MTDEDQQELASKAENLMHYFDRLTSIIVTVDFHRDRENTIGVEILAHAEHKHEFVASARDANVQLAFHAASDRIKQQIKHYKEKLQDHRRDPSHNGGS